MTAIKKIEDLKRYKQNHRAAENLKMTVVALMVLSAGIFAILPKQDVRRFIWYWAGAMALLVIICAILDLLATRKDRRTSL